MAHDASASPATNMTPSIHGPARMWSVSERLPRSTGPGTRARGSDGPNSTARSSLGKRPESCAGHGVIGAEFSRRLAVRPFEAERRAVRTKEWRMTAGRPSEIRKGCWNDNAPIGPNPRDPGCNPLFARRSRRPNSPEDSPWWKLGQAGNGAFADRVEFQGRHPQRSDADADWCHAGLHRLCRSAREERRTRADRICAGGVDGPERQLRQGPAERHGVGAQQGRLSAP